MTLAIRRWGVLSLMVLSAGACTRAKPSQPPTEGVGGTGVTRGKAAKSTAPLVLPEPKRLQVAKEAAMQGLRAGGELQETLRAEADRALTTTPYTVVKKSILPDDGDRHDYLSMGRYWWPNPDTPDGLPYVWRDGQINPEIYSVPDKQQLAGLIKDLTALSTGWAIFRDRAYANRAAELLRVFFLNPDTMMRPHMKYAQIHRGHTEVRGSGLIDARDLYHVPAAINLIADSDALTQREQEELRAWFAEFLKYLNESDRGKDEAEALNNHGTFFLLVRAGLASFAGKQDEIRGIIREDAPKLLAAQIEPDGSQPRELKRTKPFSYSVFNLIAWSRLASLAKNYGVDLWNYSDSKGAGSLRRAFEYVLPCVEGSPACTIEKVDPERARDLAAPFALAAEAYGIPEWLELAKRLAGGQPALDMQLIMMPGSK